MLRLRLRRRRHRTHHLRHEVVHIDLGARIRRCRFCANALPIWEDGILLRGCCGALAKKAVKTLHVAGIRRARLIMAFRWSLIVLLLGVCKGRGNNLVDTLARCHVVVRPDVLVTAAPQGFLIDGIGHGETNRP